MLIMEFPLMVATTIKLLKEKKKTLLTVALSCTVTY